MPTKKTYTITLDDDPIMFKIISKITGISSLPFSCPKKLLGRAYSYDPVAVFCDVHLEENLCGLDFITQMRESWPYTPIIVMTNDASQGLVSQALASGANDFVRKPLTLEETVGRMQTRIAEMRSRSNIEEIRFHDVIFNKRQRTLQCGDKLTHLPNLEAALFSTLAESGGIRVPKELLKGKLWGKLNISKNTLDKKISNLRTAIKDIESDLNIKSVYGGEVRLTVKQKSKPEVRGS